MKLRTLAGTAAALVVGAALAIVAPASPAVGFYSPPLLLDVQIESPATLVARGAAVDTRLRVICAGASTAYVGVTVTQRAGGDIAQAYGTAQIGCSSNWQNVALRATTQSSQPLKTGEAVVDAYVAGCAPVGPCGSETASGTIQIIK